MSLAFHQIIAQNGVLAVNVGTDPLVDPVYTQGLACDDQGAIYATLVVPPTNYQNGLPFDDNDRLVIEDASIAYYDQGMPFTANHAIAGTSDTEVDHYNQGVPFSSGGAIIFEGVTPPPPVPSNLLSYAVFDTDVGPLFYRMDTTPWTRVNAVTNATIAQGFSCEFSREAGMWAYGGGSDATIEVYSTATFPFTKLLSQNYGNVSGNAVRFSKDGSLLAVGVGSNINNRVYQTSDFGITPWAPSNAAVQDIAFNKAGTLMAFAASSGDRLAIFDVTTFPGTLLPDPTPPPGATSTCWSVDFHPTLNLLAVANGGTLRIYDMDTFTQTGTRAFNNIRIVRWNNAGDRIALGTDSGTFRLQAFDTPDPADPSTWIPIEINQTPTDTIVYAIAWSADDTYLSTEAGNTQLPDLRAYNTTTGEWSLVPDFDDTSLGSNGALGCVFLGEIDLPPLEPLSNVLVDLTRSGYDMEFLNLDVTPWALFSPLADPSTNDALTGRGGSKLGSELLVVGNTNSDPYVDVWNTRTWTKINIAGLFGSTIYQLEFNTAGNKCFLCGSNFLQVIDFSDLANIQLGPRLAPTGPRCHSKPNTDTFIVGFNTGTRVRRYDCTDPLNPVEITPALTAPDARTDNIRALSYHPILTNIFVIGWNEDGLAVYDESTDTEVNFLSFAYDAREGVFNESGDKYALAHRFGLLIYDTSDPDPANWTLGQQQSITQYISMPVWIDNNIVVVANNDGQELRVFDCTDPTNLIEVTATYYPTPLFVFPTYLQRIKGQLPQPDQVITLVAGVLTAELVGYSTTAGSIIEGEAIINGYAVNSILTETGLALRVTLADDPGVETAFTRLVVEGIFTGGQASKETLMANMSQTQLTGFIRFRDTSFDDTFIDGNTYTVNIFY